MALFFKSMAIHELHSPDHRNEYLLCFR